MLYLIGVVYYCMVVISFNGDIYMLGGFVNLYNYNGIGYNGKLVLVSNYVWCFDVDKNNW